MLLVKSPKPKFEYRVGLNFFQTLFETNNCLYICATNKWRPHSYHQIVFVRNSKSFVCFTAFTSYKYSYFTNVVPKKFQSSPHYKYLNINFGYLAKHVGYQRHFLMQWATMYFNCPNFR